MEAILLNNVVRIMVDRATTVKHCCTAIEWTEFSGVSAYNPLLGTKQRVWGD